MDKAQGALPRLIAPGCLWTGGSMASSVTGMLAHYSCFLLMGSQRSILIDTGHPAHAEKVERDVVAALARRPLDYIFPTHAELPHSGLLQRWLARWPDSVAVGDMRDWPLYLPHLTDRMRHVTGGDTLDLGDRNFLFVPPVWRDLADTLWGFDPATRILFLSDACACFHPHTPEQSDYFSSETAAPEVALMQDFNSKALHWPRFTENAQSNAAMDALLALLDPVMLASAHGAIVDNWREMLPLFKAGMARAA